MLEVDLRNVLEYDIETAYEIFKPMHENLYYSDIDPDWKNPRTSKISNMKTFDDFLKDGNIFFIVLKENEEKVIGYIMLNVYFSGTAQIEEIMVKAEERRHGYARRAIKALCEGLKEDEEIERVVVISATMATDNFYSSCNFRYTKGDLYEYRLK